MGSFVEDVGALSTAATLYAAATPAQISDLQFGILVVEREREVLGYKKGGTGIQSDRGVLVIIVHLFETWQYNDPCQIFVEIFKSNMNLFKDTSI